MAETKLVILTSSVRWKQIPRLRSRLEKAAAATQALLPAKVRFPVVINLLLTTDAGIRRLNHDFRGIDKATNVLSFPQTEAADLPKSGKSAEPVELGDIAIAYQYMVVEAKNDHKILINHVTHLFIHGLLHLFGYDHLTDPEATQMERLETKIMAALNLPDPWSDDKRAAQTMEPKRKPKPAKRSPRKIMAALPRR